MLIRQARVPGFGMVDVRISGPTITECAPELDRRRGEGELPANGGWLLPGLHDHHIHLRSLASALRSVHVGPPNVRDRHQLATALAEADRMLAPGQWIRAVGYHESVAGPLDRSALDVLLPYRPVRVQHRSGALWMLNSRGLDLVGATSQTTGRLWRSDSWLATKIGTQAPSLAEISARAAALGVTGFTDATPAMAQASVDGLAQAVARGELVQRVHCMAPPGTIDPAVPGFTLGPTKIILDDTALPTLDELIARIANAHAEGRAVAVHCVTRVQFVLTKAALESAGVRPGDRIEHGAVIPVESLDWLRKRRITVVTQPHFMVERGEQYDREVPAEDLLDLWRLRSLLAAGVAVAAGSDAPFGGFDPWRVLRAAVHRLDEGVTVEQALSLLTGGRVVRPGQIADLMLLRVPPSEAIETTDAVVAAFVNGRLVSAAGPS